MKKATKNPRKTRSRRVAVRPLTEEEYIAAIRARIGLLRRSAEARRGVYRAFEYRKAIAGAGLIALDDSIARSRIVFVRQPRGMLLALKKPTRRLRITKL